MRFQLTQHGWPIGDKLIPVGTIIGDDNDWTLLARGRVPPLNAMPLDQEAADLMFAKHHSWLWPLIVVGPGIQRR